MSIFVDPAKCDGCKGGEKTACMYICPNDLMILDPTEMKAYNQEPAACWECYSCVKICPQGAITARPYADFAFRFWKKAGDCFISERELQAAWAYWMYSSFL